MRTDDWETIQAAFERASELDGPSREALLDTFGVEHPQLVSRLRSLIAADAEGFDLSAPIAASARSLLAEAVDPWIGRQVGAWTIRERLATGGMGAVFLADRSDRQFEQRVAIKLVNAPLLGPDSIARFKTERQILAALGHPCIAQLHDGGTTEDGVPYLVMEYVEGLPIDRHCDEHALDIDARLDLFREACSAVDYAHRQLTVHRDLKASNVLVDAHGNIKLLDFGIAKLLDAEAANLSVAVTREGARLMTPEYASPEQVRGERVSVATDVYSLGVLLYRLLTGESPYGLGDATPLEYERAIVSLDPRRPSAAVVEADTAWKSGRARSARQLRSRLAGELDNIVLKALEKEPQRRYPSVGALSDDIGRHLRNEPVEARGTDWPYVARKFVARHARAVVATVGVVVAMAALVMFYTARLSGERDRASLAAQQASEVSAFLSSVFAGASPLVQQGETISAVNLLEQGAARIGQLADQPAVQAELYRIMGASFTQLGEYARGRVLLEQSLTLRDGDTTVAPLLLAQTLEDLGEAHRHLGEFEPGIASLRRALAIRQSVQGPEHAEIARTLSLIGKALGTANLSDQALETLRSALAMKRRLGGEPDIVTSDILGNLATQLDTLGRYSEAAEMGRQAIDMSERVNGPLHPYTLIRMSNQALVLGRLNDLEAAADLSVETIDRARRTWPPTHPRLAFTIQSYAAVLQILGRFDEAWPLLEEAAENTRAGPGAESLEYVGRLYGIANWHVDQGDHAEAIRILVPAQQIALGQQEESGYFVLLTSLALGGAYLRAGELQRAEESLTKVVTHQDRVGRNLANRAQVWLALVYATQGRGNEGLSLVRETLMDIADDDEASQLTMLTFATEYFRLAGNLDEALALGERAERIARERFPRGNWVAARARGEYARALLAAGRQGAARPLIESAAEDLRAVFGDDDARVKSLTALL